MPERVEPRVPSARLCSQRHVSRVSWMAELARGSHLTCRCGLLSPAADTVMRDSCGWQSGHTTVIYMELVSGGHMLGRFPKCWRRVEQSERQMHVCQVLHSRVPTWTKQLLLFRTY